MTRTVTIPPREKLPDGSIPGGWWHAEESGERIICDLCPRACSLKPGDRGFCFVRENVEGQMALSTYGRSTGFCVDPIEKKPLNHFLPGTAVLSFGTAGCNLGCKFCQNWDISKSREVERASEAANPETIANAAQQLGCHSVAFTYNDPVIWAEYAVDTARACHALGVKTVAVTAGYITPFARSYFYDQIDAANIDLKAFGEEFYRQLTYSHLQPVLDTLVWLKRETDVWFEITNLVIPRENDSPDEIQRMCDWLVENLGDEVPIHFTAFHPDFRMRDHPATPHETLLEAYGIAKAQGVKYVYVGNVHDPAHDSTYCPNCSALLIERNWHELGEYQLDGNRCRSCRQVIAGRFLQQPGTWGRRRQPVRIAHYAVPSTQLASPATGTGQPDANAGNDRPDAQDCDAAPPDAPVTSSTHQSGPRLSPSQQEQVFRAACEFVVAGVLGRGANLPDLACGGASELPVMGAFVTLKRSGHLRACCGTLGRTMPLIEALRGAAHRTATDDRRLPPISPSELQYLDVDVSLLHSFRHVVGEGEGRLDEVEVGRHGLTIQQGDSGGLLLPNVAVENGWDAESFLRQVCRKAGLPSYAWQESSSQLQTFESLVLEGTIPTELLADVPTPSAPLLSDQELAELSQHCLANVVALVQGATPSYYLPSCPDMSVQGVAVTLALPAHGSWPRFARMSMRPGVPLQSTLFQLCEAAARWISQASLPPNELAGLQARVSVLHDSATHGTVTDPDLRGVDPRRRILVVAQHGRYAWRYAPNLDPDGLLADATAGAMVFAPGTAGIFSFAIDTREETLAVENVPRPRSGTGLRAPAVAGVFYPEDPQALDELVGQLVGKHEDQAAATAAVLVPHAGLRFSGHIAAEVYRKVQIPSRVIILAPKHTRAGTPWAVAPHDVWSFPGRQVESDTELAQRLATAVDRLELDAAAHEEEHAIEVQLPLLKRLAPNTKVVGITIGEGDLNACRACADQLAQAITDESERPLLVISTDLNHYAPDPENRRLDAMALDALRQLDPETLYQTVRQHDISMCGLLPTVIVLQTLRNLGSLNSCSQVAYGTSADRGGSIDRVVGYAGYLFN